MRSVQASIEEGINEPDVTSQRARSVGERAATISDQSVGNVIVTMNWRLSGVVSPRSHKRLRKRSSLHDVNRSFD